MKIQLMLPDDVTSKLGPQCNVSYKLLAVLVVCGMIAHRQSGLFSAVVDDLRDSPAGDIRIAPVVRWLSTPKRLLGIKSSRKDIRYNI